MCARSRSTLALAVVALGLSLSACKKAGSEPTSPNAMDKAADQDPLAELARLEQEMTALGIPPARPSAPTAPASGGEAADMSINADGDFAEAPAEETEALSVDEPVRDYAKAEPAPSSLAERRAQAQQCDSICDLSVAICDLELRICTLSDSHRGDSTYADACQRAGDDCEVAEYECEHCDGS